MDNFDIPIFKKSYDLYKTFHEYRKLIPKADRYTVFERGEGVILDILENIMAASTERQAEKLLILNKTSSQLNLLRVFVRLLKDTRAFDAKKYVALESSIDEIGRMLGGWIRSIKVN
jgi:hypothetical protein